MLLRTCLGIAVTFLAIGDVSGRPAGLLLLVSNVIAAAGSMFLLAGLWTPVAGTLMALDQVWIALSHDSREQLGIHIFLAVFSLSVAMLGPGAWSIDARLFGRKRFDIDRSQSKRPYL